MTEAKDWQAIVKRMNNRKKVTPEDLLPKEETIIRQSIELLDKSEQVDISGVTCNVCCTYINGSDLGKRHCTNLSCPLIDPIPQRCEDTKDMF